MLFRANDVVQWNERSHELYDPPVGAYGIVLSIIEHTPDDSQVTRVDWYDSGHRRVVVSQPVWSGWLELSPLGLLSVDASSQPDDDDDSSGLSPLVTWRKAP